MDLSHVKKIGLFVKPKDAAATTLATTLAEYLLKRYDAVLSESHALSLQFKSQVRAATPDEIAAECQLVIAIGGDGTLLAAGHSVSRNDIPLIGINLGKLGFLVDIQPEHVEEVLGQILAGKHRVEKRCMLHATYIHDERVFREYDACNDVIIKHRNTVRLIELETMAGGRLLNVIRGDGVIVSTPTGSTAYALSCGGPLMEPTIRAILLVPICPHTLTNRPIVLAPSHEITLTYTKHNHGVALVSVDGQTHESLHPGDRVVIKMADHKMQLIHPLKYNFFQTLRLKFGWGQKHTKT